MEFQTCHEIHPQAVSDIKALASDLADELEHARRLTYRLKKLKHTVVEVPASETEVLDTYRALIAACNDSNLDPVTSDLAIRLLSDEIAHLCLNESFHHGLDRETLG